MHSLNCRVLSNQELMPSTYLLWVEAPEIAAEAKPGQFAMLRCDDGLRRVLRRPLSVHQVERGSVGFLYRATGSGTDWLSQRIPGQMLDILGPLGNGFSVDPEAVSHLLVAGGIGLAPLRFLADTLVQSGKQAILLMGSRSASHLYPVDLLPSGLRVAVATEDGSKGQKGLVTSVVQQLLAEAGQLFCCGPEAMYRAIVGDRNLGPGRVQVSLEVRMACGMGACLSCTVQTRSGNRHVCKDGPVFNLDEVLWGDAPVCAL